MAMREIKFRAWDKNKKEMIDRFSVCPTSPTWSGFPIESPDEFQDAFQKLKKRASNRFDQENEWENFLSWFALSDYTLTDWTNYYGIEYYEIMQYTGLKDKNGKEIYEGDIVNGGCYNGAYAYGKIIFQQGRYIAVPIGKLIDGYSDYFGDFEIIGNIYENPELLK